MKRAGLSATALSAARLLTGASPAAAATTTAARSALKVAVVHPRSVAQAAALARFDDTHARPGGGVELLLWPGDEQRLRDLEIPFTVTVPDVEAADAALRRSASLKLLPQPGPQITNYRRLPDYVEELTQLPNQYPGLASHFTLPEPTLERRQVHGVLIGSKPDATDGRPMVYIDGIHHAREWPAGEYPMIFAHHLLENYGTDPRITAILDSATVAIVPVQNPDGFNHSRESQLENSNLGVVAGGQGAYWRKNRRGAVGAYVDATGQNADAFGVDPNRNYSFLWGATTDGIPTNETPVLASTSPNPLDQTYYGTDAFSEPETRNVSSFLLSHNVTAMITNHTQGKLVLRPWGHTAEDPVDVDVLRDLGDEMGVIMGYTSKIGLGLYPTTGTTDDWFYAATAGIGYTVEHGSTGFHPAYTSTGAVNRFWPKVMEAYLALCDAAIDDTKHSVVTGTVVTAGGAPVPASLNVRKEFDTPMWPKGADGIGPILVNKDATHEVLDISATTSGDGTFEWHLNPSTRPLPDKAGQKESYQLTVSADGLAPHTRAVEVSRGQRLDLGQVVLGG